MEFKIWNNKAKIYQVTRYFAIVILCLLLTFYILKFKEFNLYLIKLNPGHLIPQSIWVLVTKLFSYCLHISINFCILLAITNRLKYSLWLIYVSFALLFVGAFIVFIGNALNVQLPNAIITIFVKANKSLVLLVIFIAGHFVRKTQERA